MSLKIISAAVVLSLSMISTVHAENHRHWEYIHNYTGETIRIDVDHSDENDQKHLHWDGHSKYKSIDPQTSGYTWGSSENDMAAMIINHYGPDGNSKIWVDVLLEGSKKNFYKIGTLLFRKVDGNSLDINVGAIHSYSGQLCKGVCDNNGLYVDDAEKAQGHQQDGHFAIHRSNIEARHFYVCVYESAGDDGAQFQVGINKNGTFNDKLLDGSTATLFNNFQATRPGTYQTVDSTINFSGSQTIACTGDLGSFAVNGPTSRTQDNMISVEVKRMGSDQSNSVSIGEKKIQQQDVTDASGNPITDKDGNAILSPLGTPSIALDNGDTDNWDISDSASLTNQHDHRDCNGGFCFSGNPDGGNSVYLIYRDN